MKKTRLHSPHLLCIAIFLSFSCSSKVPKGAGDNWAHYLGHPSSNQYSILDQINKDNVHRLQVAWTYVTGDSAMYQANNLVVDGVLFTATPTRKVTALDAGTGAHLWTFDPDVVHPGAGFGGQQRGVMYWEGGEDRRVFSTRGPWLYAINANSGNLISSFGTEGWIHLGDEMDVPGRPGVGLNTPGHIYKDLLIIGANVPEDVPGAVRAFDVRTGKRRWIFHTLPRPGEVGSETWPDGYLEKTGGASDWSGISIDHERGIVYSSTETAGPDFWGGDRYGKNLFANAIIALDAESGELLWYHQLVHHDLWDLDNPTPPTLLTVHQDGRPIDAVAQGTKMGLLFVFDRVTGEPLWPIEERPTPKTEIPELRTWPTQPFPTKPPPLMRQRYTEDDISNISNKARLLTADMLRKSGSYGAYPPPSVNQKIMFPGFDGGMEWGGSAADPEGVLYVNVNEIPWFYQLVPTANDAGRPLSPGERVYRIRCAACHSHDRAGDPRGGFPSLRSLSGRMTKAAVTQIINMGGGRMPAFGGLWPKQREALIAFLFDEEEPDPKAGAAGDSEKGPPYAFRGFQRWYDDEGYPAIKPPWGTLNAVDLNTGEIKWKVPLGEYPELTERGIPVTGTENFGGPIVTAGGLLFIGATKDGKIRAFDRDSGAVLWEHGLPFDGNATPSTYRVNGKQYVVISAGGAKTNPVKGGSLVAFALPD